MACVLCIGGRLAARRVFPYLYFNLFIFTAGKLQTCRRYSLGEFCKNHKLWAKWVETKDVFMEINTVRRREKNLWKKKKSNLEIIH